MDGGAVADEDPRISEFRKVATSDFEKDVFADGEVSDQEFQAARDLFKSCMEDRGYGVALGPIDNATTSIELKDANMTKAQMDEDWAACEQGRTGLIEPAYSTIRDNPNNEDMVQLMVDCLVRNKLVPEGYAKKDLEHPSDELQTLAFRGCGDDPHNYVATEQDRNTPLEGARLGVSTE